MPKLTEAEDRAFARLKQQIRSWAREHCADPDGFKEWWESWTPKASQLSIHEPLGWKRNHDGRLRNPQEKTGSICLACLDDTTLLSGKPGTRWKRFKTGSEGLCHYIHGKYSWRIRKWLHKGPRLVTAF